MQFLKTILNHLIYNYIFIAVCAVAMALQTDILINSTNKEIEFYGFIFFATLFSYHIYYIRSERNHWHLFYAFVGLIFMLCFLFFLGTKIWVISTFISILSLMYIVPSLLKMQHSFFKTAKLFILLSVWFLTTSILPLNSFDALKFNPYYFIHQFVFIFLLCFLFFIKDEIKESKKDIYYLLAVAINFIMMVSSLLFLFLYPFYFFIDLILLFLTIYIYNKQPNKLFYLIFVDGMMLLQTIFVTIYLYSCH